MVDIKLNNIVKPHGDVEVIHGVLDIKHIVFVVFINPSAFSKSTLLRLIAGLEQIIEGELSIDDKVVNHIDLAECGIAMVFYLICYIQICQLKKIWVLVYASMV